MARLHIESDDELPSLAELLLRPKSNKAQPATKPQSASRSQPITTRNEEPCKTAKQRSFKKLGSSTSFFGPVMIGTKDESLRPDSFSYGRRSPKKLSKRTRIIDVFDEDDAVENALEDAITELTAICLSDDSFMASDGASVCEESDPELPLPKSPLKKLLESRKTTGDVNAIDSVKSRPSSRPDVYNPFVGSRILPPCGSAKSTASPSRPSSSSSALDDGAILHYTPPKKISRTKSIKTSQPTTPPRIHAKKLHSPTKAQSVLIPKAPIRESIDAFWSQDVVNDWNEQYSPKKILASPRKNRFARPLSDTENDPPSPSASPQKKRSPVKSKAERNMKKLWNERKIKLAEDFLLELDNTLVDGKLSAMTQNTGGIALRWNKRLMTTAGRATYRREKQRDTLPDGSVNVWFKHIAWIDLAEKIVDDEEKLINVIAHEFCHLCNFMINLISDNPHGKEFQEWGAKVTKAFSDRNIKVVNKHTYDIQYKYVWECTSCGQEYKRHSKSIDPTRQSCGKCKAPIKQTKPAVRETKVNDYQLFVKEHSSRVRKENPGLTQGAIMEMIGGMYREQKKQKSLVEMEAKTESIVKQMQIVVIDD